MRDISCIKILKIMKTRNSFLRSKNKRLKTAGVIKKNIRRYFVRVIPCPAEKGQGAAALPPRVPGATWSDAMKNTKSGYYLV